jgi:septum formation protein
MPDIILASTSPYRRELLGRLGLPFECRSPRVDEDEWKGKGLSPRELAEKLAQAKAASLVAEYSDDIIIGSDQVCACEGRILGKPGTADAACEQLAFMAGRKQQLITAVAVFSAGRWLRHTDVTTLKMRPLTADEIERYVAADQPLDCAGSFRLEKLGISLFDAIESDDHTAIIGLPLLALSKLLRKCASNPAEFHG